MKEVKAFIKPNRVQKVVEALMENNFNCITLTKGEGLGSFKRGDAFPSLEFGFTDSSVVKLELVCQKEHTEKIVQIISENGRSPERGDGIIYVSGVDEAFKVKTGKPITKF
ncbi:MAG: P-II family nitrogen regulator [Cytophagales bacterium]